MKGSYILLLYLPQDSEIKTRAKIFALKRGYYAYVGSAMNSLEKRVERHFKKEKRLHWHIDYLTLKTEPLTAYLIPSSVRLEEILSKEIAKIGEVVRGFGASDLNVPGNLFYFNHDPRYLVEKLLQSLGLTYIEFRASEE
ncbi:endonuclease [Thermococcus chitonophagus]|uniref:Endonuclease n=1 Tax=Thermococcus chitonophagus TaxID=54262 RepID=A0A160VTX6_9EURY|nr:DUF123 domain-containing protein [Thermococcus chitonophagus]ASJ16777.1 endonuclease [Thermococcus chitonophagus]CUX78249.1 putative endonuclease [Thermococcus chitonophagus]